MCQTIFLFYTMYFMNNKDLFDLIIWLDNLGWQNTRWQPLTTTWKKRKLKLKFKTTASRSVSFQILHFAARLQWFREWSWLRVDPFYPSFRSLDSENGSSSSVTLQVNVKRTVSYEMLCFTMYIIYIFLCKALWASCLMDIEV